jgi:hypothetical protein
MPDLLDPSNAFSTATLLFLTIAVFFVFRDSQP